MCMLARGGRHGAMQLHQVFVYGTLKRGFFNYDAVLAKQEDATFVEAGTTTEAYPMFVDYYKVPYLVHRPGEGHRIVGELFSVGDAGLAALDKLEGVPGRYDRFEVDVARGSSAAATDKAWLYAITDAPLDGRTLLPDYTAAIHADYTPPGARDARLYRGWGGYEEARLE